MALSLPKHRGFEILPEFDGRAIRPTRATKRSAGYDIHAVGDYYVQPGEMVPVDTGLTAYMLDDEELQLRARSGLAFKHQITLQNGIGTIDADYYGNHIRVLVRNEGHEVFAIEDGDRICQGVFAKFLTTDDYSDNNEVVDERQGGFGSTGVK